jgi:cell division protein FtsI (penicillin-binding protein 3)
LRDVHPVGNGPIPVIDVFKHSSNVGVSKLIWRLYKNNPAQFVNRLYAMRLNKKLGIELLGEAKPKIKHPKLNKKEWYGTSLPWMSVGYEVELTPLQILTFYNAVANNGIMMKPRFVTEIKDGGLTVKKIDTVVLNPHIASASTIKAAQKMLQAVVEENGTGKKLKNEHFKIAGKTGTAQKAHKQGGYGTEYIASFVALVPGYNPDYIVYMMVDDPKPNHYGSTVVAPAVKEIMTQTLAYYGKLPEHRKPTPLIAAGNNYTAMPKKALRATPAKMTAAGDEVPDLKGMPIRRAIEILVQKGFVPKLKGQGMTVTKQLPSAGEKWPEDKKAEMVLWVS